MSQRTLVGWISLIASGLALLVRVGGLLQSWDANTAAALHVPLANAAIPFWLDAICAALFATGTAIIGVQVSASRFRFGLLFATLLQPISAMGVGALAGSWVSPFTWQTAIASSLLGITVYHFSDAGKRERRLQLVFGKNLSESSLTQLKNEPASLDSRSVEATVLSARFLGHDWAEVETAAAFLREKSAWVELQTGNRLLAVWNIPLPVTDGPDRPVEATLELAAHWQIGVSTGEVSGRLPASDQWQMQGTPFEKADALCQANATFGSHILLDLATADRVRDSFVLRPVDFLKLPTHAMKVEIFEPLASSQTASAEIVAQRDRFWEAVIYFRQKRFSEALAAFQKSGDDPVVDYYLTRLEKLS